ncbi:S1C family serine protease [Phytoactinopolyspora halotolerans]|uniref:PDZ domain-containing protein n=1 Tax=Phytoactinopolyspora halotolerans TaxID=1981512 RepID=A0A6L9S5V9_9ACTN|nr:trypsin-like peptidase domain-containing protein [Phytoactinopolyspora halotolerans]NEE00546.1 PDZ domain-containing protein [Phytoactinopolyspora halotolerans]
MGGWIPIDGASASDGTATGRSSRVDPWAGGEWTVRTAAGPARTVSADRGHGAVEREWVRPGLLHPQTVSILRPEHVAGGPVSATDHPGHVSRHPDRRMSRRAPIAVLFVVAVLLAGALGGIVGAQLDRSTPGSANTVTVIGADPATVGELPDNSTGSVAAAVLPSVVSITSADGGGSGFVISTDGYVLTNHHVVASGADVDGGSINVELFDGRRLEAEIVGASPSYDLAVLHVEADDLEPVVIGDSAAVEVGDPVIAIGSPLGLDSTVTSGIISALDRPVTAGSQADTQSYINALQTDAAINPGNSGGPLVDTDGRVIGVNSAIATLGLGADAGSIGLGFAIPIDQASRTAEQLITDGEAVYPIMGALLDNTHQGPGARVADGGDEPGITPDGPAERAGVRPGDVITELNGERIRNAAELIVMLRSHEPGEQVTLTIERGDSSQEIEVTLGSQVG